MERLYSCQLRIQNLYLFSFLVHIVKRNVVNAIPLDLLPGHPSAAEQFHGIRLVRNIAEQTARECYPEIREFTYDILWNDLPKEVQDQLD